MRPITKPPANALYKLPKSLVFAGGNAALLQKTAGITLASANYSIGLSDALDLLLEDAQGNRLRHLNGNEQTTLVKGLMNQVTNVYKTAAAPLTQDLGAFCSYCGSDLPGLIEVEHTVPKAPYPKFATDWDCFLLSCGPCNTSKSNAPSRADVIKATHLSAPTERDLYDLIRKKRYVWPDLDPTCWVDLPVQLEYFDTTLSDWVSLAAADAMNLGNTLIAYDVINHKVLADVSVGGVMTSNVQVAVKVRDTAGKLWTTEMIDLMQFNEDVVKPTTGTYDRRQMNRTRAWFSALAACNLLKSATDQFGFDLLWQQIPMMGASSGFYSVWVTVLERFKDFNHTNLATRFVAETNVPLYYPNTCTSDLP